MTLRNPLWTQAGTTSAEEDRALLASVFPTPGVVLSTDLAVTQHSTPNMSVDVAAGRVVVSGTESSLQGRYLGWLDATTTVAITASDATNPRIDLVVARFKDAQYSGAANTFTVEAVTGTPAGSPVAPAAPANSFILAQISVAALSTTVLNGAITDKRNGTGGALPTITSASLYPAAPFDGLSVYRNTNDVNEGPEFYNGSNWRKPWNLPWGFIGRGASSGTSGFTTVVDVPGAAVAFTAVANRKYRVTIEMNTNVSTATTRLAVVLTDVANTQLAQAIRVPGETSGTTWTATFLLTASAGATTWKLRGVATVAGTGTVNADQATQPCAITVEDAGPVGAPS